MSFISSGNDFFPSCSFKLQKKNKKDKKTNTLKILLRIFKTQQIVFFNFCRTELQGSILFHEFLHFLSEKGRERSGDYGKGGVGEGEWGGPMEGRVGEGSVKRGV